MRFEASSTTLTRQVIVSALLAGIALVFILFGQPPGWQPFAVSGILAGACLITALSMWRGSRWLGLLALSVLLLSMFWERERPLTGSVGLVLAVLSTLKSYQSGQSAGAGNDPQNT
jgi:hypothetical protein